MENKKGLRFSTLFLIFAIIIIVIMGYFLYEFYNQKLINEENIVKLNTELNKLSGEIADINTKEDDSTDNEKDSFVAVANTDFYGVYISSDKIHKLVFLPNGEMCSINNDASEYKVMPGTYYIEDDTLYYSTSQMLEWFEGRHYAFPFEIVDRNTLTYNQTNYTRTIEESLNGKYNSMDGSITFTDNGTFEINSTDGDFLKGNYVINNDLLELNYESEETTSESLEITYLILDKDTIVAQWEIDGKLYYEAYIK